MTLNTAPASLHLRGLAVLRIQGSDAFAFLQGQLSNDIERLHAKGCVLAGLHNPQGRTIALLRLIGLAADEVLAVLPAELAADVLMRLRKYILRAKVKLTDESAQRHVIGGWGAAPADAFDVAHGRWLAVRSETNGYAHDDAPWRAADIADGLPQVYRATSEAFIAQMLNLDCVDAISFNKGCYTGQEVIARAHYRGRVKRRMQRFCSLGSATLQPGDSLRLADQRAVRVVEAVQLTDGRCEFLGVAPIGASEHSDEVAGDAATVACETLPLPYALPLGGTEPAPR